MKKVEIIGAAIVDVLVSPANEAVFRTGSAPCERIVMTYGGDALNEATVLRGLGAPVRLVTVLGSDDAGEAVRRRMERVGLDLEGVQVREELSTSVNVVLVKENGERSFLTCPTASQRRLRLADITMPFPADIDILCLASIFVFPQLKTPELAAIFRQAKEQGITVCADMTKRKNGETVADMAPALRYVDYLFPNEEEAMLLTGGKDAVQAARMLSQAGVGTVVVKCGSRGCFIKRGEEEFTVPAVEGVRCVDTTGAGDSFVGGFLYGLANDLPLRECAVQANLCGARAVEKVGATTWVLE